MNKQLNGLLYLVVNVDIITHKQAKALKPPAPPISAVTSDNVVLFPVGVR